MNSVILNIVIIFLAISLYMSSNTRKDLQKEAIKRNYAEWVVDEKGHREFKWKDNIK